MKITNVQELKKEMLKSKKTDKAKSSVLMMLLDYTQKIAKEKREEPNKEHLKQAIKKYFKIIEDQKKNGLVDNYEEEILNKIKDQNFPKQFGETELKHIILEYKNDNPDAKTGQIMGYLKKTFGDRVNMKMASKLVNT